MAGSRYADSFPGRDSSLPLGSASSVGLFHFHMGLLSQEEEVRAKPERPSGVRAQSPSCALQRGLDFSLKPGGDLMKNLKWEVR